MKNHFLVLALSGLFIGSIIVSCKKDDDKTDSGTGSTTSTTSTTSPQTNPLVTKECSGKGDIEVGSLKDTMYAMESLVPPLKLFAVFSTGRSGSLTMQSGYNKLPETSKVFSVLGDPDKLPGTSQVILSYFDDVTQLDYYAVDGTVTYTISLTEKTVKFNDILFRTADNTMSKNISYEVKLK
jgi:hypothetical protein